MRWLGIVGSIVVPLIGLGACLTLLYLLIKGLWWCMSLMPFSLGWLIGKPPTGHGSAHFARARAVAAKGLFTPGSIPLGTYQGRTLYEPFGGQVVLIGPPRSRKSWGLVMPAIERWPGSIVVNDMRGELYQHTSAIRRQLGPVYRFSPTQHDSCAVNVVDLVRWGRDEAYGDVQRLVHGLLSPAPGEPWNDFRLEAEPLLVAVILDRHAAGEGHLPAVVRWMTAPGQSMTEKAKAWLRSPVLAVQAGGRRFLDKSERLQAAVWSTALSALVIYQDPLVAANTSRSDLDLSAFQEGLRPVSLYLTPPFSDAARLRPLLGTLVEMLTARFSAQRIEPPRQRVLLCLDELANLGRLPELERGMSYLQGCGVQVLATWQNLPQCTQTYGPHSPLLASIATHVYYTPTPVDRETARHVSDALGVATEVRATESRTVDAWEWWERTTHGEQQHARALMTPDEVARLPEDAALVLTTGLAPIMARKLSAPGRRALTTGLQASQRAGLVAAACVGLMLAGWAVWQMRGRTPQASTASLSVTPVGTTPAPSTARRTQRVSLPIEYTGLPRGFALADGAPREVHVDLDLDGAREDYGRLVVDLAWVREGANAVRLTRQHVHLAEGVQVPHATWGNALNLRPAMLTLTVIPAPGAPAPQTRQLIEVKERTVVGTYPNAGACAQAHGWRYAEAKAMHQPPPGAMTCAPIE
jgi:type IV secretory pathway TraG/TraD family ATPase VirD4